MARPDGAPKDVDREVVESLVAIDENQSLFIDDNVKRFAPDPAKYDKYNVGTAADHQGDLDLLLATGSGPSNIRWTINGYQYASGPTPQMKKGDRVRWYVVTLGEGFNFHTPHWHGNTVLLAGQRTDVLNLAPAQMATVDMVPNNVGTWLFHCHVSDHMEGGMASRYEVLP
jgi:manganese oxidase